MINQDKIKELVEENKRLRKALEQIPLRTNDEWIIGHCRNALDWNCEQGKTAEILSYRLGG
jgi:hypothetical protein